jgi:lysophospholipase L1-like esterase
LVVALGLVVAPATSAQAVTIPPLEFPAVSLAPNLPYPQRVISQTDGGVTIGGCGSSGGNTDAFAQYGTTGSLVQTKPLAANNRSLYTCPNQSAVGADGTVYTNAYDPPANKEVLVAFQGGTQKWVYAQPCSSIVDVQVGTNGTVYMLVRDGSGCSSGPRLVGVEPELASGQSVPTVVANTTLTNTLPNNGGLSPYSGGVIVRFTNGVGFYNHTGTLQQAYTMPAGSYDGGPFATINGWAIVPQLDQAPRPFNCTNDTQAADYISAYSVSGLIWSHQLPDCSRVDSIRPMPDGGAVAVIQVQTSVDINGPIYERKFYGIPPTTGQHPRWTSASFTQLAPYTTDLNGNVVTQTLFTRQEPNNLYYPGVKLRVFSGYSGIGFTDVEFYGGQSDGYGFSPPGAPDLIPPIGKGVAYVPLRQCNPYGGCDNNTAKVYAAKVPGLAMDYPRGAVLNYNAPWKNYVAMGDSFSSGEGVPTFMSPSDTNDCHRSHRAYSRLLDDNTGSRWNLTAFVACSGATTADVINGKNGENPQIDALSSNIDTVTMTIGGNDIGFEQFVYACLFKNCGDSAVNQPFFQRIENDLTGTAPNGSNPGTGLLGVYGRVKERAPTAKVYAAGYPQLLPTTACTQSDGWMAFFDDVVSAAHNEGPSPGAWTATLYAIGAFGNIPSADIEALRTAGVFEFNASEAGAARLLVAELNEEIEEAAQGLNDPNFKYVDPLAADSPFTGHELCTDWPYFNGLDGSSQVYSFHPNELGQDAYRQLFVANF